MSARQPTGRVFVLNGPTLTDHDRTTLQSAARAVLLSHHGTLADQLARRPPAPLAPLLRPRAVATHQVTEPSPGRNSNFTTVSAASPPTAANTS